MKHYLVLLSFLAVQCLSVAQVPDSLFTQARDTDRAIQERVLIYDEIAYQTSAFDLTQSVLYSDTAVVLARNAGDSGLVAIALNGRSIPLIRGGKFVQAEQTLKTALKADSSDLSLKGRLYSKIALVQQEQGLMEASLTTKLRCYEIFKEAKDTANVSRILTNLGSFYADYGDSKKAKKYIRKALSIQKESGNDYALAASYRYLSEAFEIEAQLDSALYYARKTTDLSIKMGFQAELAAAYLNQATILEKMELHKEAIASYAASLEIADEIENSSSQKYASMNLGTYAFKQKDYTKAKYLFLKSVKVSDNEGTQFNDMIDVYKSLSDIYLVESKLDSVQFFRNRYEEAMLYKFDNDKAESVAAIAAEFEDAQQKALIAEQDLALQRGETKLAEQRAQNITLLGGLIVLALGVLFWFFWNKNRQELVMSKALFEEREKGFVQVVEATEAERDRISKDLHDGIGQQLTALKFSLNALGKKVGQEHQDEIDTVLDSFTKSAEDVRLLSHQMMPRMLMDFGLPEAIDDLLKNSFLHVNTAYEFNHRGMTERLDKNLEIAVYRVIQELINNALKHADAELFSVQLIRSEKKLAGFISDDGKGFKAAHLADGHGLKNMKNRLELIGGALHIDSATGKGTSVSLSIPLS